jgi:hypothetical protein
LRARAEIANDGEAFFEPRRDGFRVETDFGLAAPE